ncbi:MAG: response regulator [Bacteroidetes bacterium]|nr:response regulator [Bacteroidota bacterium]
MTKTVLIIDDNDDIRENTAELLELEGFRVFTASGGMDGIRLARENKPDAIVCDVVMPDINGYEVFEVLQNNEDTKDIRFIFVTALSQKTEIDKAYEIGATCYLVKPFDEKQLIGFINGDISWMPPH